MFPFTSLGFLVVARLVDLAPLRLSRCLCSSHKAFFSGVSVETAGDPRISRDPRPVNERHQHQQRQRHVRRSTDREYTPQPTLDDTQRDDNEWRVVSRRRSTQYRRTPEQCVKCGETNHVTARCKHAGHVQCRQCGQLGHKEKHHAWDKETGHMATGTSHPNYMCAGNNAGQSKWDIPTVINLNARSLSIEKLDELKVTGGIHDVSVVGVSET